MLDEALVEVADYMQVSYGMATSSALAAMSCACQALGDVVAPNGHESAISLMLLTVAPPGERKTALERIFHEPVRDYEARKIEEYQKTRREYQSQYRIWHEKQKELYKKLRKSTSEDKPTDDLEKRIHAHDAQEPKPPAEFKLIFQHTTPRALPAALHASLGIGYLHSDEAGSLFTNQILQDVHLYNDLWNGTDIKTEYKTTESILLKNPRLTSHFMIQNERL
ncbi:DUF3987 domain-containing protein, partial [Halorhodospira halochloris]|uniref:DUF3987 domain-containing protein n=1 Tax=Halorhodospira halochloris TaxID=1052 RepID=UPI001EE7A7CA